MFKSTKKSWFDRFKRTPREERNIEIPQALEGVAEQLKRVANAPLEPHRPEFQAELLAKIREARGTQRSSMFDSIKQGLERVFSTPRMKAVVAFVVLVAVVATTVRYWPDGGRGLLISPAYAHDNFEVTATKVDSLGVATDSVFVVKSKMSISTGDLEKNLSVIPGVTYKIDKVSDHEFHIVPTEPLKPKTVYKVYINSAYVDQNGVTTNRDYSWAFQIKNTFKVIGTLPRNKATGVPVNSGIEITFNSDQMHDVDKHFSISPKVDGRFEYHGRTVSFVPKELAYGTIYTVTLDKNVPLKKSDEKLSDDTVFQFETENKQNPQINRSNSFSFGWATSEFPTDQNPFLQVFPYGDAGAVKMNVSVYTYKSAEEYLSHLKKEDAVPDWSINAKDSHNLSEAGLTRVTQFSAPLTTYGYNTYLVFPSQLPAGYYLVVAQSDNDTDSSDRVLLQVTDVATFLTVNQNKVLVWLNNVVTGKPVANAEVQLSGSATKATTDKDGLASFDSHALSVDQKDSYDYTNYKKYLVVKSGGASAIAPLYGYDSTSWSTFDPQSYWSYLYTDRPLYQGNDTVNVWGFVQSKNNEKISNVTLQVLSNSYDYFGDPIIVNSQTLAVNANGSFDGAVQLKQAEPGSYSLVIKVGDNVLTTRQITVDKYIKPLYQLEIKPYPQAIRAGQPITYDVKATFFDGTAVPDLDLSYQSTEVGGTPHTVKTDASGNAHVVIPTTFTECDTKQYYCQNPINNYFTIVPLNGEEGKISAQAQTAVYSTLVSGSVQFEQNDAKTAKATIHTDTIDLDTLNQLNDYTKANKPVSGMPFTATVVEYSYLPRETGEYYDFVNKKTVKTYDYDRVENPIDQFSGVTGEGGNYERQMQVDPEKSYEIRVVVTDDDGHQNAFNGYLYTARNYEQPSLNSNVYYSVKNRPSKNGSTGSSFSLGEQVTIDFKKNDKVVDDQKGRFLFYRVQKGLIDYTLQQSPTYRFIFEDRFIPNIQVLGIWFDGRVYHQGSSWYGNGYVYYNNADRELHIALTTDKAKYQPGEDVTLSAKVIDKNGTPVQAALNLNLVDEAYYQIAGDSADPLGGVYSAVSADEWYSYISHKSLTPSPGGGAEGGACFVAGTKVLMADGTERNIEDVQTGDTILTFASELDHVLVQAKVKDTIQHVVREYVLINGKLGVTPEHRIFVNNSWMQIGEAKVGDTLLGADGSYIKITSIEKKTGLVPVYNLHIADKHTYIADGFYVHNDKGGDRSVFTDTAGFVSVQTDKNGQATTKITLPDNITSWRVTVQGMSKNVYAGVNSIDIPVTKPVFVESTFASEYILGDKPIIKARAYGDGLEKGNKVNFTFSAPSLNVATSTQTGQAFTASYFNLTTLSTPGTYTVRMAVDRGNDKDAVIKPLVVIPSRSLERVAKSFEVKNNLQVEAADAEGKVQVDFIDQGRAQLQNALFNLSWQYGDRVDQRLGRVYSQDMLRNTFGTNDWYIGYETFDGAHYQTNDGGISLLPYSSSELELSVEAAPLADKYFDSAALKSYFYGYVSSQQVTREELVESLSGLAALNEPVLTQLQAVAALTDLSPRERMFAALGLAYLGDNERARHIYNDMLEKYGKDLSSVYYLNVNKNDDDNTELTALAAVIGSTLHDEHAQGLWNYIQDRATTDRLIILPELSYITQTISQLSPISAEAEVSINGQKNTIKTSGGYAATYSLTKDELAHMKFSNVKGSLGLVVRYYTSQSDTNKTVDAVRVKREYMVNNRSTQNFKEGDIVTVTLNYHIDKNALQGGYEVIDHVPSGLKPVVDESRIWRADACYPFAFDGQTVKFDTTRCDSGKNLVYQARVVNPGEYVAEAPIIQSFKSPAVKNYGQAQRVTVTQK